MKFYLIAVVVLCLLSTVFSTISTEEKLQHHHEETSKAVAEDIKCKRGLARFIIRVCGDSCDNADGLEKMLDWGCTDPLPAFIVRYFCCKHLLDPSLVKKTH